MSAQSHRQPKDPALGGWGRYAPAGVPKQFKPSASAHVRRRIPKQQIELLKGVPLFAGLHVYKAADPVCAALTEAGGLLARGKLVHSNPQSWRSKAPLIFRTTPQWFIAMDRPDGGGTTLRQRALAAIDATRWVPAEGRTRIAAMVTNRPDWCLSRQRVWGTPITVLYSAKTGEAVLDDAVLEAIEKALGRSAAALEAGG